MNKMVETSAEIDNVIRLFVETKVSSYIHCMQVISLYVSIRTLVSWTSWEIYVCVMAGPFHQLRVSFLAVVRAKLIIHD